MLFSHVSEKKSTGTEKLPIISCCNKSSDAEQAKSWLLAADCVPVGRRDAISQLELARRQQLPQRPADPAGTRDGRDGSLGTPETAETATRCLFNGVCLVVNDGSL